MTTNAHRPEATDARPREARRQPQGGDRLGFMCGERITVLSRTTVAELDGRTVPAVQLLRKPRGGLETNECWSLAEYRQRVAHASVLHATADRRR
jgi:hypothetical protein